jgi:hypothetical protein
MREYDTIVGSKRRLQWYDGNKEEYIY